MKKKILVCLFALLMVFTLTGCGKNKEDKNLKEIKLSDEGYGTTIFKYDQDKDYEVKEETGGKYKELIISSEKDNFVLQIYHTDSYIESYNAGKSNRENSPGYKEYTWNGLQGYIYNSNEMGVSFNILLKESDGKAKVLFGSMDSKNYNESKVLTFFNSSEFQKVMNSITFTE